MRILRNNERVTGSTKTCLIHSCCGESDSLAVRGMFILILAATSVVDYVGWKGLEVSAVAGSICIENEEAGWQSSWELMPKNDCAEMERSDESRQ